MTIAPDPIRALVGRYDAAVYDERRRATRIRLVVQGKEPVDVVIEHGAAVIVEPRGRPDAELSAHAATWAELADDAGAAMSAYRRGRLVARHDLHAGIGFLAATSGAIGPGRLRFHTIPANGLRMSVMEAGTGPAVLCLHGLGASKGSFLTTLLALAGRFRVIAFDLPGSGDSDKPIGAPYDAAYFAGAAVDLLDALHLERAHLIGNSLGGRVALEVGLRAPDRVERIALLAPSLAWRRQRHWAPFMRLLRPELGLVQIAPRRVVSGVVRTLIPGAEDGWAAAGVDEFLRAYCTPAGRAAFYAAGRHIFLEEPDGEEGFWTRLAGLEPPALFVWGKRDRIVPIAFERHVKAYLPSAEHLELDCGHVPQIERPKKTHEAVAAFLVAHDAPAAARGRRAAAGRR